MAKGKLKSPPAVTHQGRVVEVREDLVVLRPGVEPLEVSVPIKTFPEDGPPNPGDRVTVYDDGSLEVAGREPPEPVIEVPSAPQQDHP